MHIPDGFIDVPTSLGAGAVAAGAVAVAVRKTSDSLEEKAVPMAGLVAAFVFAAQMVNFPVAAGTSGHLMGGVLAAILVGPWAGFLCITVVLGVQTLFADGGVTALGLNIVNLGVLGCLAGFGVFVILRRALPGTRTGVLLSAALASGTSVLLAAGGFVVQFALGGTAPLALAPIAAAMGGVHLLIGLGEALVTIGALGAVLASRPDLVYGARDLPPSVLRSDLRVSHP